MNHIDSHYKLFIGGEWVDSRSGKQFQTFNPSTGALLATCASADKEDVDDAVKAAWRAFDSWKKVSPTQRATYLLQIADAIDANAEHLAMRAHGRRAPLLADRVVGRKISSSAYCRCWLGIG